MIHYGNLLLSCPDAPVPHRAGAWIIIASGSGQSDPAGAAACCKRALEILEALERSPQPQYISEQDLLHMREDAEVTLAAVELLQLMPAEDAAKSWESVPGGSK